MRAEAALGETIDTIVRGADASKRAKRGMGSFRIASRQIKSEGRAKALTSVLGRDSSTLRLRSGQALRSLSLAAALRMTAVGGLTSGCACLPNLPL